jgi:DNA (cytosine-5)-methyltransferase 1
MANRRRLLDLYCCAGGCAMGYRLAGFDVVGVDIEPQPNYPFEFHQGDAIEFLLRHGREFDAIHASPPCQHYSALKALSPEKEYPDLIGPTRDALRTVGRPYVIENVMSAPLLGGIVLCGAMFGLRTYRHRRFETSFASTAPKHPKHVVRTATKQRRAAWAAGLNVSITGDVGTYLAREAMGIDWMNGNELCQAIPPAYTRHIGRQLLKQLAGPVVAGQK